VKIRNIRNGFNKLHYKVNGMTKIVGIKAGKTVDLPDLKTKEDIVNYGDITRGFFEIVIEGKTNVIVENKKNEINNYINLEEVKKEIEDYSEESLKKK